MRHSVRMAMSTYLRRLRERLGPELLVLPSVTVLPSDGQNRILLVRRSDTHEWMTIGGMVEPDEAPADAATREAHEEAGIDVRLEGIHAALGGPEFRLTHPNGDEVAYVSIVYAATVVGGEPRADGDETDDVAWVSRAELPNIGLSAFARAQLERLGYV
jgi:8-oxo-dGTP pyrophosphatase MutT (NUDIX family)